VYGIVKQSGGHIWAYSEPGKGTTFKIYLPTVLEAPSEPLQPAQARLETRGTETILILEDEAMVRKLVEAMLAQQGYTILVADSPEDAVRYSKEHTGSIDLLVTDVVMPDMNGRQVAQEALRHRPALKVLYMSGYTSDAIAHHGVLDSGVAFLHKPFSAESLIQKVREVLDS
jgi:DNA-binding response OmpR family regulator